MEQREPVRKDELKHEDIVIGTNGDKRLTGNNNLCVVMDVVDGIMNQEKQFIISFSKDWMKRKGSPATLAMHEDFDYDNFEDNVREHEMFNFVTEFVKPFYEFKFGDRIPQLKKPELGIPVYIGKDPERIHVAYISAEKWEKDCAPVEAFPIAVILGQLDQGKKKIKVRYINIEDDTVTVTVVSMDQITDMKELLYQIGG